MARVNKYQIDWQIARTKARKEKTPETRVGVVRNFIQEFPTIQNYERVKNWTEMSILGYRDLKDHVPYTELLDYLNEVLSQDGFSEKDLENNWDAYSDEDLLLIHKDLSKRNYGFRYKTTPKSHIFFMHELENVLESRELIYN